MIYMETTLVVHPDKIAAYLELAKDSRPLLEKNGGKVIGAWQTAIGNANEITILFAFEDMGQLQKSMMALGQDKDYQAYWGKALSLLISHSRKIMMPMPMSPLK